MVFEKSFSVPASLGQILSNKINIDLQVDISEPINTKEVLSNLYADNALKAIEKDFITSSHDSSQIEQVLNGVRGVLYSNAKAGIEEKLDKMTLSHFTCVLLAAYLKLNDSETLNTVLVLPTSVEDFVDKLFLMVLLKQYEENNIEDISLDKIMADERFQLYKNNRVVEVTDSDGSINLLLSIPTEDNKGNILEVNVNDITPDLIKDILNMFTPKEVEVVVENSEVVNENTNEPVEEVVLPAIQECTGIIEEGSVIKVQSIKTLETTPNGITFQINIHVQRTSEY